MARPQKEGIDYFPLDVDMDHDDKMALVEAKYGLTGFAIVIKLLMKIYGNGYFYKWTEKEHLLFSNRVNVDINTLLDIINESIKWTLFDSTLYENYEILTSRGIQKRYFEAVTRRKKVELIHEYSLVNVNDYKNIEIVNINPQNVNINPQRKEEERRVKESKVEERKENNISTATSLDNDFAKVLKAFNENIHFATPIESEKLGSWLDDLEAPVIISAIEEAVVYNKRSYGYIRKILESRLSQGIKTDIDLKAYKRDREDGDNNRNNNDIGEFVKQNKDRYLAKDTGITDEELANFE